MADAVSPRTAAEAAPKGRALRAFLRHRGATVALFLLTVMTGAALLAPWIAPYDPEKINILRSLAAPSAQHWLGTDEVGRDVLSRLLFGGRVSIVVGLVAATLSVAIGVAIGGLSAYFGGLLDAVLMRFTDGMLSIPLFFFLLVVMAVFGSGLTQIVIVIALTSWMPVARIVRGEVLRVKALPYVEAAEALGARRLHVILRHLLPQTVPSVIVAATLGVANAILLESALSYLGLGIQPPIPSWGNMLQGSQAYVWSQPLLALWPGLMIFVAVMAYNALGDGIRDALDPGAG
ncbi:MAG: ABC transporter permease [Trueperaceae bacterium]|nr:ABC transporter permease [Trueperaceae bacterium]